MVLGIDWICHHPRSGISAMISSAHVNSPGCSQPRSSMQRLASKLENLPETETFHVVPKVLFLFLSFSFLQYSSFFKTWNILKSLVKAWPLGPSNGPRFFWGVAPFTVKLRTKWSKLTQMCAHLKPGVGGRGKSMGERNWTVDIGRIPVRWTTCLMVSKMCCYSLYILY